MISATLAFGVTLMTTFAPSSNSRISVNIVDQKWSASLDGKEVIAPSRLSLDIEGEGDILDGATTINRQNKNVSKIIPELFGRNSKARDDYNQTTVSFKSKRGLVFDVVFRCYNDAIAFRYEIPTQKGIEKITIADENSEFNLTGHPTGYLQYLANYKTPHEHPVTVTDDVKKDTLIDLPAVFEQDGRYVAVTEAALRRYAGMALMRNETGLVSKLTPREDGNKVVTDLPMKTPWRVVMVTDRLGALLESDTLYCLNEPNAIGDTSWIKPGKITWPWWNGNVVDPADPTPIFSMDGQRRYIDFCAANDIAFHAVVSDEVDKPWYVQAIPGLMPGPGTDVMKVRTDLDLPAIRAYAKQKGVRLWTWVHQATLRGRVEEAFAYFERIGWEGMMVDFFDHDDQDSVEFSEEILKAAARHRILIHFHGIWKPNGLQRTYPNLMNHEGALNLEYLKWSDTCTPEHTLKLAFTRLVAGPMDYHLGGFRAVKRADFKPVNAGPNVLGTRGHMLASYVCFDNPTSMVADYPAAYKNQPGFEFLEMVPTWWDETRVLRTEIGILLVTARRKGKTWYVGGLSAGPAKKIDLPLDWLGSGTYNAQIWSDAPETETDPNRIARSTSSLTSKDTLTVDIGTDGGFVARLDPR